MAIIGTSISNDSPYFCPVCGSNLTNQGTQADYRPDHKGETYDLFSCKSDPACAIHRDTVTLDGLQDADYFVRWHTTAVYSLFTGKELNRE